MRKSRNARRKRGPLREDMRRTIEKDLSTGGMAQESSFEIAQSWEV